MPVFDVTAPDGKVFEVNTPEGGTEQDAIRYLASTYNPELNDKSVEGGYFTDLMKSGASGVLTGIRGIIDVLGAENPISQKIKGGEEYLAELLSAQAKKEDQKIAEIFERMDNEGTLEQFMSALEAFSVAPSRLIAQGLGTAVPFLIGGLLGAGARTIAGLGAAQGVGITKDAIYQATKEELLNAKVSEDEAERIAQEAQSYAGKNIDQLGLGALTGLLGSVTGIEKRLIPSLSKNVLEKSAKKSILRRTGETAITEAVPEFLQGGQERLSQNIALQREGFETPTMQGVFGQGAFEAFVGAGLGAGVGAITPGREAPPVPPVPPAPSVELEQEALVGPPPAETLVGPPPVETLVGPPPAETLVPIPGIQADQTGLPAGNFLTQPQFVELQPMSLPQATDRLNGLKLEFPSADLNVVAHPSIPNAFAIEDRPVAPPLEPKTEAAPSFAERRQQALENQQRIELAAMQAPTTRAPEEEARQVIISRALQNIEERGGVASPSEAQILQEANLGTPYDRVDPDLAPKGTADQQLTFLPLQPRPREAVTEPARQERQQLEDLIEETSQPAPLPDPNRVIEALRTPTVTRSAEQVSTVNLARSRYAPSDIAVLERAADGTMTDEDASRLNTIEQMGARFRLSDEVSPETKAIADELRKKLLPVLKKFGLGNVALRLLDTIEGGTVNGAYLKQVIFIALDSDNPMGVMRHEVIHALKELGAFTDAEWKVLSKRARGEWINRFIGPELVERYRKVYSDQNDGNMEGFQEYIEEEAIAEAFKYFDSNKPPAGMIANLMRRLNNMFQAIKKFFGAQGLTAENIFRDIEAGRLQPGIAPQRGVTAPAFSLRDLPAPIRRAAEEVGLTENELLATSLPLQTGGRGDNTFKTDKVGGLTETIGFLEDRRLDSGAPTLDIMNDQDHDQIAKLITAEAMAAIRAGGNALDWYDGVIQRTLNMASLKHPELATDINAGTAFKVAMAITSQGLNVEDNIKLADRIYTQYKRTGKFPEMGSGEAETVMKNSFRRANDMINEMGFDDFRTFLETPFTVRDLQKATGLKISGEMLDERVLGSSIFGPKIGFGFYSNLNGNFEPVTMDMWFMRTIGRLTGKLRAFDETKVGKQIDRFVAAMSERGTDGIYANQFDKDLVARAKKEREAAMEFAKIVNRAHEKDFKVNRDQYNNKTRKKSALVNAAGAILKSLEKPIDAPTSGGQRRKLRAIFAKVRDNVRQLYGKDVPSASLQAVIWYPEQSLYKSLGVKLRVTNQDYAGAMRKILQEEGYDAKRISTAAELGSRGVQSRVQEPVSTGDQARLKTTGRANEIESAKPRFSLEGTVADLASREGSPKFSLRPVEDLFASVDAKREVYYKDRSKLIRMNIDDFLALSEQLPNPYPQKKDRIKKVIAEGQKLESVPVLLYDAEGDRAVVSGHEGRHRAIVLKEMGYTEMPVEFRGNIRWSEQDSADKFDYKKTWPSVLVGQKPVETVRAFPVSREQSTEPYTNAAPDIRYSLRAPKTPEFQRFFKDSKAVDADGQPLVVYHGTNADITEFDATKLGESSEAPSARMGFFFAKDPRVASSYATTFNGYVDTKIGRLLNKLTNDLYEKINEKFLRLIGGASAISAGGNVMPVYLSLKNPLIVDFEGSRYRELTYAEVISKAKNAGHDGVILKNTFDEGYMEGGDFQTDVFVVFEPTQIKSAISNRGTFDTTKPDIRYSLRAPKTPEFKRFFGNSKITNPDGAPKVMYHGTARDIEEFRGKQAGAIFLTDDPVFAETFGDMSETYMAQEYFNNLNENERKKFIQEALKTERNVLKQQLKDKDINRKSFGEYMAMLDLFEERSNREGYPKTFAGIPGPLEVTAIDLAKDKTPSRANIMPLYVRAERPFDYANPDHVNEISQDLIAKIGKDNVEIISRGSWKTIETPEVQRAIREAGFDGFYVLEAGRKNLAVYNPKQIKSAIGNIGTFDDTGRIRYNLVEKPENAPPQLLTKTTPVQSAGKAIQTAVRDTFDTIQDNDYWTKKRMEWVDQGSALTQRLKNLLIFDPNGTLRADMLKHAQAQVLNLIRMGIGYGIPFLNRDGTLSIQRSENNFSRSEILADALNTHPNVVKAGVSGKQYVAEIARALRGKDIIEEDKRLNALGIQQLEEAKGLYKEAKQAGKDGNFKRSRALLRQVARLRKEGYKNKAMKRELQVTPEQIKWAEEQLQKTPEVQGVLDIWKNINTALIDLWEAVGLLSPEQAQEYRDTKNYVPLFKSRDDLNNEKTFALAGVGAKTTAKLKKLEGSESIRNIWENLDKQYATMIAAAYENQTRRISVQQLEGLGAAQRTNISDPRGNLKFKENGQDVNVIIENPNVQLAFQTFSHEVGPVMKFFGSMTRILRAGALINPMFWLRQLVRDSMHATLVANSGVITPFHAAGNFIEELIKGSPEGRLLAERGVIGQMDSTIDMNEFLTEAGRDRMQKPGVMQKTLHKLLQIHEASDAATRIAVFKRVKAKALKDGMSEEQAIDFAVFKARESINFSVKGMHPFLNSLRQMIPFINATIVGLDTLYRAATGYGLNPEERKEAMRQFRIKAGVMVGFATAYAMMYANDDDYNKLPDYVKDNNFLIPIGTGEDRNFIKLAIPYEVGFLFKTVPEVLVRYLSGNSTGKEMLASYWGGLLHNLPTGGTPIPQAVRPGLEVITNYSFFTGRPIEGMSDQGLPKAMRGDKASEFAKVLSRVGLDKLSLSPAQIDYLMQGYFAELGTFSTEMASSVLSYGQGKNPPEKNLYEMPFFRSFMTNPNSDKAVADFYEVTQTAQEVSRAFTDMANLGKTEEARAYLQTDENRMLVGAASALRGIRDEMSEVRQQIRFVRESAQLNPEEKDKQTKRLQDVFNTLARRGVEISESLGIR
jgi:hypothetical protein